MPQIEFTTFSTDNAKNFKPVLAKNVLPEWWKKMKVNQHVRGSRMETIRACPAMDDWLKSGWYIVAVRDIEVIFDGNIEDGDGITCFVNGEDNSEVQLASPSHPAGQFGYHYANQDDGGPVRDAFKVRTGWNVTTPPGYSVMFLDPFLFQNRHFVTWQGIVDSDTFTTNQDTTQCILYPKTRKNFTIKAGTPIVQIVPYKREDWTASYMLYKHETWFNNLSQESKEKVPFTEEEMDAIGLKEHQKQDIQMSMPERERYTTDKDVFGPYRSKGYWHEKGRFFNESNPPPECPFHNMKRDDDNGQLELPLE